MNFIAEKAAALHDGARPVGRLAGELIETPLARLEIANDGSKKRWKIDVKNGIIDFE